LKSIIEKSFSSLYNTSNRGLWNCELKLYLSQNLLDANLFGELLLFQNATDAISESQHIFINTFLFAIHSLIPRKMTDKLPPNLLQLFQPRPPLRYLPHADHAPEARKTPAIGGLAAFLPQLEEYKHIAPSSGESWFEKKERAKSERREKVKKLLVDDFEKCILYSSPILSPSPRLMNCRQPNR
jgi:hypothetical protein